MRTEHTSRAPEQVRSNLDPFDEYTDTDILHSLGKVRAASTCPPTLTIRPDRFISNSSFTLTDLPKNSVCPSIPLICARV